MVRKIKAIIFDWGWTLHNPETDALFPGVPVLLKNLSQDFILVLVSLAKRLSPEERRRAIKESGIAKYFRVILVGAEDKNESYEKALADLKVLPKEVVIVDDRVVRGIAWGNRVGAVTVWLKNGKFANELPTEETGNPTFTITTLAVFKSVLFSLS